MEAAATLPSRSKPSATDGGMVRDGFYCYLATPFDAAGDVDMGQLAEYVSEMSEFRQMKSRTGFHADDGSRRHIAVH